MFTTEYYQQAGSQVGRGEIWTDLKIQDSLQIEPLSTTMVIMYLSQFFNYSLYEKPESYSFSYISSYYCKYILQHVLNDVYIYLADSIITEQSGANTGCRSLVKW